MNGAVARPSDDELSAWIDGALPAERQAAVGAWLAEHPDDAARVRRWAADGDWLRQQAAPLLEAPVPAPLRRAALGASDSVSPGWRQAALVAGLLVAGAGLGAGGLWQWQRGHAGASLASSSSAASPADGAAAPAPWVRRAAYAHSVYVPEPRHAVEVRAQEEHLARWLTRRIDVPVKLFDLHAHGFELVGGRLLPDGAGKSAQLMYQDRHGVRVTVYLRRPEVGTPAAFRYERQGDLGLFYWVEDGAGYALVGALPREQLLALAQSIYRQEPTLPDPTASTSAPAATAAVGPASAVSIARPSPPPASGN